jgi:hypothetical protein
MAGLGREEPLTVGAPDAIFTTFVLIYVVSRHGFAKTFVLTALLAGAMCELVLIPLISRLSDRFGRKQVYLYQTGAVLTGLIAYQYFAVLTHGGAGLTFIAVVVSLFIHALQYGPQAALIGENFQTHLRYGGAGLGYQLASVCAGAPAADRDVVAAQNRNPVRDLCVHRLRRCRHGRLRPCPPEPFPRRRRRRLGVPPITVVPDYGARRINSA